MSAPVDYSKYKTIKFERRGRVLNVTLNQPEKLNSVSPESHDELARVFIDIDHDSECDVVVLAGAGRAFSAGGDLINMQKQRNDPTSWYTSIREGKRLVSTILECEKPIVCKVHGDAIGLGATIALLCDVVIASEAARFADPHNSVGLAAGDGGHVIWPQLIGFGRARHYLLTGEKINGRKAADIGLIHEAVPAEQLDAAVDAYVEKLLALPAQSLRWTKNLYSIPLRQLAHGMMDIGICYEALAGLTTQDHLEAITAFGEKRKPKFVGK
ncbi:MAG: enoyl-CoA hydratase/isomerase family protein [Rhodocyclaceae bacterium]|jgi:enoyl-CoA hydratase|nr:enoyl-CoA hydratase/isomerase family protein [Rhodocyclaceae bacterium]